MSFESYCATHGITPEQHLARSESIVDLVPQPEGEQVAIRVSRFHGLGVFPTQPIMQHQEIGLALDAQFHRTDKIGRYVNHSDDPSAYMDAVLNRGVILIARRGLTHEDEVTIDYHQVEELRRILLENGL
jgi:hypothetical protein